MNTNSIHCSSASSSPSVPMMLSMFCFIFAIFLHPASSSDLLSSSDDAKLQQMLCARFPGLAACQPNDEASRGIMTKRKSAYMRFGRAAAAADPSEEYEMEKRKSAYMRFGKRSPAEEGETWAANEPDAQMEKRKSAYMRFGKRKSAYMRFGRNFAFLLLLVRHCPLPTRLD
ncbi:hypothetical protein niasHS_017247 [Heterodera schachtii]|uniref:Uncharacterized protein n=1 Tax=Heterodera schachtii TaxID=97005 RepID=A0ABD2I8X8_HETSC